MVETTLTDGSPVTEDHKEINPVTGMQKGYVVLNERERAKGFVRPVRLSYKHVGSPGPKNPLRDLTDGEKEQHSNQGYIKFEVYPEYTGESGKSPVTGRFWSQEKLDAVGQGCGTVTVMNLTLAETYARDPKFYGGTFCSGCRMHYPIEEFVWVGTGPKERVGS